MKHEAFGSVFFTLDIARVPHKIHSAPPPVGEVFTHHYLLTSHESYLNSFS